MNIINCVEKKRGERAILWYQSSIRSMKVITHYLSSRPVAVWFYSCLRDFATFHSLLDGDTLVFSLIANSESKVYLKGGTSFQLTCNLKKSYVQSLGERCICTWEKNFCEFSTSLLFQEAHNSWHLQICLGKSILAARQQRLN